MDMFDFKKFRENKDLTQEYFSELLGVPQSFISSIERGKQPMPKKHIAVLRKQFGDEINLYISEATKKKDIVTTREVMDMVRRYEDRIEKKEAQIDSLLETIKSLTDTIKNSKPTDAPEAEPAKAAGAK